MKPIRAFQTMVVAGLLAQASSAWAVSTWGLVNPCSGTSGLGNAVTCTSGPNNVTASAWSTTGTGGTYATAEVLRYTDGMAVRNSTEGYLNQSIDNLTPGTDMLMLSFASAVKLSAVSLGYVSTDSDISVLAYTGGGTPASVAGKTAAGLLSSGWSLVTNYNGGSTAGTYTINGAGTSSSWWLISAYNSSFGGALSTANDYVRLLSVAGDVVVAKVPEPASLALVALALTGFWGARRRALAVSRAR